MSDREKGKSEADSFLALGKRPAGATPRIKLYDFRRPDKFSREQIRTISVMHEGFSRLATARLMNMLRTEATVEIDMVDQLTYKEFVDDLEQPSTLLPVSMKPLKGVSLFQVDTTLSTAWVDRMYGGRGAADPSVTYTHLEQTAVKGMVDALVEELGAAWKPVTNAAFQSATLEKNKGVVTIVPPSEMIVLVTWNVQVADTKGFMRLAVPYLVLEPILGKLSAQWWYSSIRRGSAPTAPPMIADLPVEAEVEYEATPLTLDSLTRIQEGDRIPIPEFDSGRAVLRVGGKDLMPVSRGKTPGEFLIAPNEAIKGEEVLARVLGDTEEHARHQDTVAESVKRAVSESLGPVVSDLRTELSRMAAHQAAVADSTFSQVESDREPLTPRAKPFDFMRAAEADSVALLLTGQHPQIVAMVVAHLEPRVAAAVLAAMDASFRPTVVRRLATIDRVAPRVISLTEEHIANQLRGMGAWELQTVGGVDGAGSVLNFASRNIEREVIEALDKMDPELTDQIKKSMFVFDDIADLDSRDIAVVLSESDLEDVAIALTGVGKDTRNRMLDAVGESLRKEIDERIAELGRIRLTEVDAAQQRIVETTRRLDLAGQIVVERPNS